MDDIHVPYRLSLPRRESGVHSEDDRDLSSSRKHHKAVQRRKASTVSMRDTGKTRSRGGNGHQSLAQTSQEMTEALKFVNALNSQSDSSNQLSTFEEVQTEHDDISNETALYLTKLTLEEEDITRHLQKNEATNLRKKEHAAVGINLTVNYKSVLFPEPEEKNVDLEDKLTHDVELVVTGIMNLSAMNLTDNDLPTIIQRAFVGGRNKCIGLILRDNSITSNGVKMIVDAVLTARSNLKYLSFSNNPDIGDAGIEHLVRLLQKCRSIIFLAVPGTGMTDRGVRLLADILCGGDSDSSPPPLEKLYISFNKSITDESLEPLLQILEQNQTLKVLSVEHCSLSDRARKRLRQMGSKTKKKKFSLSE